MDGLNNSKKLFFEFGEEIIKKSVPEAYDKICVGLVGHGSECFGFDDNVSEDHDFDNGFCIFINDEDDVKYGVSLSRAYNSVLDYAGIISSKKSAFGGGFHGVHTINSFYRRYIGDTFPKNNIHWYSIPQYALAEATNGEVFYDGTGDFSKIRNELLKGYPNDVRLKRLSKCLLSAAQSGQYNYNRCLLHGEKAAANTALYEFLNNACEIVFLLNNKYMPYYKWQYRAMRGLPILNEAAVFIEKLALGEAEPKNTIETVCSYFTDYLKNIGISEAFGDYLEPYAYSVFEKIEDRKLKSMHILE